MSRRHDRRHATGNSNTQQPTKHLDRPRAAGSPDQNAMSMPRQTEERPQPASVMGERTFERIPSNMSIQRPPSSHMIAGSMSNSGLMRIPSTSITRIPSTSNNISIQRIPSGYDSVHKEIPQRLFECCPTTALSTFTRTARELNSDGRAEFPEHSQAPTHIFHKDPDARYPWRDPKKQLTSTTEWTASKGETSIKPLNDGKCFPDGSIHRPVPPGAFHSTFRGKGPGGFMDSTIRPSSSSSSTRNWRDARPSTALGLSSSVGSMAWSNSLGTLSSQRPAFDTIVPPPPKPPTVPPRVETLEKIRKKLYEKAVNLKTVFRHFDRDKDGTVSRAEFKKALIELNLDFPEPELNGLIERLDEDGSNAINYQEFESVLNCKATTGEYNPFLIERTYYDGAAKPADTGKDRFLKLTAKDINDAYKLHEQISKRFYQKYKNPRTMFRDIDDNSNGSISSEEFVEKLKLLNVETTPGEIDKMIDVFKMPTPGQLTYEDFVEYFQQPDQLGFADRWNPVLRLGKGQEKCHPPMDSRTMQKTKWDKEGRPHPRELLRQKKQMLKDLVEDGKTINLEIPTKTIVLPGKTKKGFLDKFLLEELRRKFTSMRKSTRDMFGILDNAKEGRISRDNFHKSMKELNMGIPENVLDELISYVDSDNCGYVELPEFVQLIEPSRGEELRIPTHDEEERAEIARLMHRPHGSTDGIPTDEIHRVVMEYLQDKRQIIKPNLLLLIQEGIQRKRSRMRDLFLKWDADQDGFIDATELRKGLGKLDYNEFVHAFHTPDNLAGEHSVEMNDKDLAKCKNELSFLNMAVAQHAISGGMPPAGLVKGGASKTLKMNLDKYKVGLQRPQSGQRPQSAAGTLFYGQNPGRTTPFPDSDELIQARQPWKELSRDELRKAFDSEEGKQHYRSSWTARTEEKRHRVQSAHLSRTGRSVSSMS